MAEVQEAGYAEHCHHSKKYVSTRRYSLNLVSACTTLRNATQTPE